MLTALPAAALTALAQADSAAVPAVPPPRRRRRRAAPRPPRPRRVVMGELRGLGGLVLEQALLAGDATPQPSVIAWCGRLARELGVDDPGRPATYRQLMVAVLGLHRAAQAHPERPIRALPVPLSEGRGAGD